MSIQKKIAKRTTRRTFRVRNKLRRINRSGRLRIAVYRSNKNISAQIIDDSKHVTLVSFSSRQLEKATGDKTEVAKQVGLELGKRAAEQKLGNVFFDRGHYLYHGRIKALADGLRESGLQF